MFARMRVLTTNVGIMHDVAKKMPVITKKVHKNLHIPKKYITFAADFRENRLRNQASPQQRTSSLHSACTDFVTS